MRCTVVSHSVYCLSLSRTFVSEQAAGHEIRHSEEKNWIEQDVTLLTSLMRIVFCLFMLVVCVASSFKFEIQFRRR